MRIFGSALGSSSGATVNFQMSLYRTADAKQVWEASYYFRDQALSENLLKIGDRFEKGQGAGWRTALRVISDGFRAALRDFSAKRQAGFIGGGR